MWSRLVAAMPAMAHCAATCSVLAGSALQDGVGSSVAATSFTGSFFVAAGWSPTAVSSFAASWPQVRDT